MKAQKEDRTGPSGLGSDRFWFWSLCPESRSAEPQRDEGADDDDKAQPAAGEEEDQLADEDQ